MAYNKTNFMKGRNDQQNNSGMKRRDFLTVAAVTSLAGTGLFTLLGMLKIPFPRISNHHSQFKVGRIVDFPLNTFTFVPEKNIYILRERNSVKSISATCTHLGCITTAHADGFRCPCHGSEYGPDGKILSGPAPQDLPCFQMTMGPGDQLIVDTSRRVSPDDKLFI